jgi:GNAT superfamily N-acetyltransferase
VTGTNRPDVPVIRPATLHDVPEIRSILAEHGNDGPHPTIDIVGPYVRHLVTTARALVADEGGRLTAFGATVATGHGRHLTDLFVRTDRLGQGIGRLLLDALFMDDWPRTTFASDDPRALPLYIRAGMAQLHVHGERARPRRSGSPATPRDVVTRVDDASRSCELNRQPVRRAVEAKAGGEHANEPTRTCVSERRSRQRRYRPILQAG